MTVHCDEEDEPKIIVFNEKIAQCVIGLHLDKNVVKFEGVRPTLEGLEYGINMVGYSAEFNFVVLYFGRQLC